MYDLLCEAGVGRLATTSAAGVPHIVPICFACSGDRIYTAVDDKPKSTRRLRRLANISETGRAALLVDHYVDDWARLWWVRVDAHARIVDDPPESAHALAALAAKYQQYAAQPPSGPVIALDIERISGWSAY